MTEDSKLVVAMCGSWRKGQQVSSTFASWWRERETIAARFGLTLTHASGDFETPSDLKKYQAYRLPRSRKRFEDEVRKGNVRSLDLLSMNSKPDGYLALDWDISFSLGQDRTCGILSMVGIATKYLRSLGPESVLALLEELVADARARVKLSYGFAVVMPRDFMPDSYAMGVASAEAPAFLVYDANTWLDFAGRSCRRVLRNVFAYNVLSREHLRIKVGKQPLSDWIADSDDRGVTSELGEGIFLWLVSARPRGINFLNWDSPHVVHVRKQLEKFLLFPWQTVEDTGSVAEPEQ